MLESNDSPVTMRFGKEQIGGSECKCLRPVTIGCFWVRHSGSAQHGFGNLPLRVFLPRFSASSRIQPYKAHRTPVVFET